MPRTPPRRSLLLFTASDWSKASATFEQEIRNHAVFTDWLARSAVLVEIDLPRLGLSETERKERRTLATRYNITAYPTAILFDAESKKEQGRLHHETEGPAAWVRRAERILAGQANESNSPRSLAELSNSIRQHLEDPDVSPSERARRHYEQVLSFDRLEPEASLESEDRFLLLNDLLRRAVQHCPETEPSLRFTIQHWRATLQHRRVREAIRELKGPTDPEAAAGSSMQEPPDLKAMLRQLNTARSHYARAVSWAPGGSAIESNLALLEADRQTVQDHIDFQKLYEQAVEQTQELYLSETAFKQNLERFITTLDPVNDAAIENTTGTISQLVDKATALEHPSTTNFVAALEDIERAPEPHVKRDLQSATTHIRNALEHLIQESQQMNQQPGEGGENQQEEEQEDPERDGEGDRLDDRDKEEQEEPEQEEQENQPRDQGQDDARLRGSGDDGGDLRERMLERRSKGKEVDPGMDH